MSVEPVAAFAGAAAATQRAAGLLGFDRDEGPADPMRALAVERGEPGKTAYSSRRGGGLPASGCSLLVPLRLFSVSFS